MRSCAARNALIMSGFCSETKRTSRSSGVRGSPVSVVPRGRRRSRSSLVPSASFFHLRRASLAKRSIHRRRASSPLDNDARAILGIGPNQFGVKPRKFAAKSLTRNDPPAHFRTFALDEP